MVYWMLFVILYVILLVGASLLPLVIDRKRIKKRKEKQQLHEYSKEIVESVPDMDLPSASTLDFETLEKQLKENGLSLNTTLKSNF